MRAPSFRIGIDLGGTKIEIAALDPGGAIVLRERVATPHGDYDGTIRAIIALVQSAEARLGRHNSVGLAIPGTVSTLTGTIKNANSTWLNGRALEADLVSALERPVRLANDANCFALSEASDGAAAGAATVFGVILGTGVGGGVVVNGQVLKGAHGLGGEWGHNPLPAPRPAENPGPACYCGRNGCIETFLCGPALERDYRALGGKDIAAAEIATRAAAEEPMANSVLDTYIDRLARALGSIVNVLDPDCIVLGGGVSNIQALYQTLPRRIQRYAFTPETAIRVVRNAHGDSSGVRGAAWLWPS